MISTTETTAELRRQLFERLRTGQLPSARPAAEPSILRASSADIPLSCGQQRVWLHSEFTAPAPIYNESITICKTGPFDPLVLERCFNELIQRHAIWRTAFSESSGQIRQIVHPADALALPLVDLSHLTPQDAAAETLRLAAEDARRPFDLSQPPLLRARLFRVADGDHRLYLTFHHLVFDGVSIYQVLLPELAALYGAFSAGQPSPLLDLAVQYADYSIWQQRKLSNGDYATQLAFWRDALRDDVPVLELPATKARPASPTWQADMESFALSPQLSQTIRYFSAAEGATLYMTLLAAFHVLLYRYSRQEFITTGGVVSARNHPDLGGLIGFLLNTVVLRSRPNPTQSFRQFLGQMKSKVLSALENSDVPFDAVVRELAPKRDSNHNAFFQTLFSLRPSTAAPDGWEVSEFDAHSGASGFDLFVDILERSDSLAGRFIYSSDLFDRPAIRRMISHWSTILEAIAANPDQPLGTLPVLTNDEQQFIVNAGAGPAVALPATRISTLFEEKVAQIPNRLAVVFEARQYSYRRLNERATIFAKELEAAGARPGSLVAVSVERSIEMLVALLGILKAGAAYLPVDQSLPPERREFLIKDAKAHFCVNSPALAITKCPDEHPLRPPGLAYVLYTSGSTGVPKGVEVPEHAVLNLLRSMQREPGFAASDILLAVTTLSFDIAALELFLPLISGGTVVIAPRAAVTDPAALAILMRRSKCTVMQATPATWRALIDSGWGGSPSLKILCGGEVLLRSLADQLLPRCDELWNMYGPTETTIWSTVERVEAGQSGVPIGHPIDNTQVYVLDRQMQLAPLGVLGELFIGGDGVAVGYVGRPDLDAERFPPSPFTPNRRIYRTGDLVRWTGTGQLEFLGRADHQVKVRGYRIELQEVEDVLLRAPGVKAAAVKAWRDASGENSLVAYVEGTASANVLRDYLSQKLPGYMIPSRFVACQALPLTPNGKLDRKALPEPGPEPTTNAQHTNPLTDTQRRLVALWAKLLKTAAPDIHADFFHLGGHSLLAAELVRRIDREFGKKLSLSAVFESPTIATLSTLIDPGQPSDNSTGQDSERQADRSCLHWVYAGMMMRPLAACLRLTHRLQGISLSFEMEQTVTKASRLEDVARLLVDEIRRKTPTGPYNLGGWCVSGILAYEAAVQLEALGETVSLLALVGSPNPEEYSAISKAERLKSKLLHHWKHIRQLHLTDLSDYLVERAKYRLRTGDAAETSQFSRILLDLALEYKPKPIRARVVLFQSEDRPSIADHASGWGTVVNGRFDVYEVPGNHVTSLQEPNVTVLARRLRACLAH